MKIKFLVVAMLFASVATFAQKKPASPDGIFAEIETNKGKIVIDDKLKVAIDAYYEQYGTGK